MRNCLLKVGQANPCGLSPVHLIYIFINTLFFPKCCVFSEEVWLYLSIECPLLHLKRLIIYWVSYFLQLWESHLHKERERDTCYVRYARRLLVLLLHAKIILSWETDVRESQSTTKLIVWGAQSVLRTASNARLDLFTLHSLWVFIIY